MEKQTNELMIISEENIKDLIYEIRGEKVMLDFDLARIYGYETRRFNEQVKNNNERFPERYRFQLTKEELSIVVMSKKSTSPNSNYFSGQSGGTRKLPYAFTESGIYMLISVLKGPLAVKQSIIIIDLFKKMKDYIIESENNKFGLYEVLKLSNQVHENTTDIKQLKESNEQTKLKLEELIKSFSTHDKYIYYQDERLQGSNDFKELYSKAKESIIIVDDYISSKNLEHLKVCFKDVVIYIFSDNQSRPGHNVSNKDLEDFRLDTGIEIKFGRTNNKIHDRYYIIDYKTDNEVFIISSSSEKDVGNRVGTTKRVDKPEDYYEIIDELLKQLA